MAQEKAEAMDLPKGFSTIRSVNQMIQGNMVKVIGMVKDYLRPIPTRGPDYKSSMRLFDTSTEESGEEIELVIFREEHNMPEVEIGDVIVLTTIKVQKRSESEPVSLLTNKQTTIHVYDASKIPKHPGTAASALKPPTSADKAQVNCKAEEYVCWAYQNLDKSAMPDRQNFSLAAQKQVTEQLQKPPGGKFSLLKDIRQDKFCDFIACVVKDPYDLGDKVTIWVTDYTENAAFYHRTWNGVQLDDGPSAVGIDAGDPLGYANKFRKAAPISSDGFCGPYGKRCLQMTCYEPHATQIRDSVRVNSWVYFRNIQIKYGSSGTNLEGFLREDRGSFMKKKQAEVLNPHEVSDNSNPHFKDALRRKRDYEKTQKTQMKDITGAQGKKRAAAGQPEGKPLNAKQRRQLERTKKALQVEKAQEKENSEAALGLNTEVRCENMNRPPTSIDKILERVVFSTTGENGALDMPLPFTCAKYRANVRVVDFYPPKLEDFAVSRKASEYEMLSDDGDVSDSDEEGSSDEGSLVWEWRFALRLQEATKPAKGTARKEVWVMVDNFDAQLLTSLDACDLRSDQQTLADLRERMFILWGELEEYKAKKAKQTNSNQKATRAKVNDRPPLDSSDVDEPNPEPKAHSTGSAPDIMTFSNCPFSCCIQQYGIRVPETNPRKADAGEGKRWERMFSLFGVKIRYA